MAAKLPDFLKEKWQQAFEFFDVDKDGKITREDYALIADNISRATNASEEQANTTKEEWVKYFRYLQPDPSIIVDETRYITACTELYQDIEQSRQQCQDTARDLFDRIDFNKDGLISVKEFEIFYKACEKTSKQALETFRKIDTNGDGFIERDELVNDLVRFFTDSDPISGQAYIFSRN